MENPFSWREKTTGQTPNNFIIIKSITIILVYVSGLLKKKKSLLFFFTLTHTKYLSQKRQHFTLSSLAIFLKTAIPYSLLPLAFLPIENLFSLSWFHALFSPPHREDLWAKTIKFFVVLSIYKTLLLFPLELRIHYLFNKESISS